MDRNRPLGRDIGRRLMIQGDVDHSASISRSPGGKLGPMPARQLLNRLKDNLAGPLPGKSAHLTLAPPQRGLPDPESLPPGSYKPSAVLVLLYTGAEDRLRFPLIRRAASPGVHSAQIALPGGRVEETDSSPEAAALRECREEIGLEEQPRLLGKLSSLFIPVSGFLVHPFVASVEDPAPRFTAQAVEVESVIPVPVDELLDPASRVSDTVPVRGASLHVPCFRLSGATVWGATAMILNELRELALR